jgi:lambda repressor-like predicted transcriptional regulator
MQSRTIRRAIRQKYPTIIAFAREMGVARSTVEQVLAGKKSTRIATAIAECMGLHPHDLWPAVYPPAVDSSKPAA